MKKKCLIIFILALFGFNAFSQNDVMFALSKNENDYRYSLYYSNQMLGDEIYTISIFDWFDKTMYIAQFDSKVECIETYNMYAAIKRAWTEGSNSSNDWIIDDILIKMKDAEYTLPDAGVSVHGDKTWKGKVISSAIFSINSYN